MEFLSQIFSKGGIPATELKKLLATNSPVENIVKALAGQSKGADLQSPQLSLLKNYLPDKIPLGKAFDNLLRFLSSLPQSELTPQTKETLINTIKSLVLQGEKINENLLKNFITKTGLNYEADIKKLIPIKSEGPVPDKSKEPLQGDQSPKDLKESLKNSVKGQLMQIIQELETKLGKMQQQAQNQPQLERLQALLKTLNATLSNVELNQILNYYSKQEDGFLQFQIPFSLSETIDLYIKDNAKKNGEKDDKEKEDISLVFNLNLETMGNIRIDIQMLNKSLSCRFYAEDKEVSVFISSMLPGLELKLKESYSIGHLSCVVKGKSFFEDESPEKKLFKEKTQIISVKA